MTPIIEWRVTCLGLQPRYFDGKDARLQAHRFAYYRAHLSPTIWWRENHGRGTGPWIDITNRDPNSIPEPAA